MTYLASGVEVCNLTLLLSGYQFGSERQAYCLPSSNGTIHVGLRHTLIPHVVIVTLGICAE